MENFGKESPTSIAQVTFMSFFFSQGQLQVIFAEQTLSLFAFFPDHLVFPISFETVL